jgi:hypothetical protein
VKIFFETKKKQKATDESDEEEEGSEYDKVEKQTWFY